MTDLVRFGLLGLPTGATYALLGLGLVIIYRGSGVINFAQGGLALVGAFLAYELRVNQAMSLVPVMIICVSAVSVLAVLVHVCVMRPLRTASPLARVIATLAVLTVLSETVVLRYSVDIKHMPTPLPSEPVDLYSDVVVGQQGFWLVAIAAVVTAALTLVASRTTIGHAVSAAAENPRAASALGWSPELLASLTWGLGGALAGLVGVLFPAVTAGYLSPAPIGLLIIGALAAALMAEFCSYPIVLISGLLVGVTQSVVPTWTTRTGVADAVPFLFIVVVLVVRGKGLPLRGTMTDRLPRVGTGVVRPVPVVVITALSLLGVLMVAPDRWHPPLIVSLSTAIMGLSVVVLTGYTGQLSLAQFALGGVGALTAGRLVADRGWEFGPAALLGIACSTAVGLCVGLPALRTRGVNLAVVTFGLGFAIAQVLFGNTDYTTPASATGATGLSLFGISLDPIGDTDHYAAVCLVALTGSALVVANLRRSRTGRRLLAVRTNERAAAALGINVFQTKLYAFALSSAIAGLGGILVAFSSSTILYQGVFSPSASIALLVLTVIGGTGYVMGPVIGGVLAAGGLTVLLASSPADAGVTPSIPPVVQYLPLATAVLLILVLIASQDGVAERVDHMIGPVWRRLVRTRLVATTAFTTAEPSTVPPRSLTVRGATQKFGEFVALSAVDIEVHPGEVVGLLGPNGAGKTTLIDSLTGYNRLTEGQIILDGHDVTRWAPHRRSGAGLTRSFQSLELFDDITVRENLLAASDRRDLRGLFTDLILPGRAVLPEAAAAAVTALQLEGVLDERPQDLGYGQRRLIAIARAIANRPSVLLLDEPAAGLDENESAELGELIRRLADHWGIGVLLIEHDVNMVLRTADRVVVLDFGVKIAEGSPEEIRSSMLVQTAYLGAATEPQDQQA